MKNSVALLALAAGVSQVTATGWNKFPSFTCPQNTDNKCVDKQKAGFSWGDLSTGSFSSYAGFDFKGWTCENDFSKRDLMAPRTFGKGKVISGSCGSKKETSPSFGCGAGSGAPDKFSIDHFAVSVEFDCDLEFHYDMPDGSTCKHRSPCSRSGTTVKNSQCGGAKNVTIVYPAQPSKPKPTCGVGIHTIGFDCSPPQSPVPPKTRTGALPSATTLSTAFVLPTVSKPVDTPAVSVSKPVDTPAVSVSKPIDTPAASVSKPVDTPAASVSKPVDTPAASVSKPVDTPAVTMPAQGENTSEALPSISIPILSIPSIPIPGKDTTAVVVPSVTKPVETPAVTKPVETPAVTKPVGEVPSVPVPANGSQPAETETVPAAATTPIAAIPETKTTVFDSTSTIFTTSVQTITSCGPEVADCPANSHVLVTVTVPLTTTVCPVTQTIVHTPGAAPSQPAGQPAVGVSEKPVVKPSATKPAAPLETLPCPDVVPQCLSSWMWSVGCKDNSDANCYCPDAKFVENVFSCIYSYGASDEVISKATQFFQGICAPHIPQNPAIVTVPAAITPVLTVPAASMPVATNQADYTTVIVDKTIVVPCVTEGTTIPGSSTTATIKTTIAVPAVSFATDSASIVVPVPAVTAPGGNGPVPTAPYPTGGPGKTAPIGTGGAVPTATGVVVAGAGKTTFGLGAVVAIAALAAF